MQIEEYLRRDDRVVLPTGSTEQHGSPSLGTAAILPEGVAVEAAEPLGIPVLPALPFGMAPYFAAFPGSMSLRMTTYIEVLRDLLDGLAGQGFRRIAVVNGHGGNAPVTGFIREWICQPRPDRGLGGELQVDQGGRSRHAARAQAGHSPRPRRAARPGAGQDRGTGRHAGRRLRAPGRGHA